MPNLHRRDRFLDMTAEIVARLDYPLFDTKITYFSSPLY